MYWYCPHCSLLPSQPTPVHSAPHYPHSPLLSPHPTTGNHYPLSPAPYSLQTCPQSSLVASFTLPWNAFSSHPIHFNVPLNRFDPIFIYTRRCIDSWLRVDLDCHYRLRSLLDLGVIIMVYNKPLKAPTTQCVLIYFLSTRTVATCHGSCVQPCHSAAIWAD